MTTDRGHTRIARRRGSRRDVEASVRAPSAAALLRATAAGCAAAVIAQTAAAAPPLMDWPDLLGRPMPAATRQFAYGPLPAQVADLWLPDGKGPFPVVLMVHGGCWRSRVAKLTIMNWAAEDLRRRGIAVWNIEYRGVDVLGGGYPGTFQDVAAAADELAKVGPAYHLKLDRVVAVGHSAGGHLAPWLAARGHIAPGGPLSAARPLPIAAVVSLGGLPDLELARRVGMCGEGTVEKLTGPATPAHPAIYADTSPAELPVTAPTVLINGVQDGIAPPEVGAAYVARMKDPRVTQIVLADTGHVELIAPGAAAWSRAAEVIDELLRPTRSPRR
ncbi:MAG TPA: alpha/beta hydrolase [Caulobacteraceae bacterium]|jgi:acetyl esterase/lipase